GEGRYRLLETVRQYARDRLPEAGEGEAVRVRQAEYFLRLSEEACAAAGRGGGAGAVERLEQEHDNLRAALAWAVKAGDRGQMSVVSPATSKTSSTSPSSVSALPTDHWQLTTALRLAGALWEFWHARGYWDEGRQWLERALAAAPDTGPSVERARALAGAGR